MKNKTKDLIIRLAKLDWDLSKTLCGETKEGSLKLAITVAKGFYPDAGDYTEDEYSEMLSSIN